MSSLLTQSEPHAAWNGVTLGQELTEADTHRNKVLHHIHVGERVDFSDLVEIRVNSFDTGQRVSASNVHSTRAADA